MPDLAAGVHVPLVERENEAGCLLDTKDEYMSTPNLSLTSRQEVWDASPTELTRQNGRVLTSSSRRGTAILLGAASGFQRLDVI